MNWTPDEEEAFTKLEEAGPMSRLDAIRLFQRCDGDLSKALAAVEKAHRLEGRTPYIVQNWEAR
ncbi:MAG TPA: hypothetical protein VGR36_07490, partial [Candidatus Acidoferrales bacterium]|nr:hypothetical protein [Candidatus Acidoferrales bacterium]